MRPAVRLQFQELAPALALASAALACSGTVGGGQSPGGGGATAPGRPATRARGRPDRVTGGAGRGRRRVDRDRHRGQRRPGHLPDDGDHADAAAPADEVRVRQHGPSNLLNVDVDRRQRPARRRGHGRLQQQRRHPDGVVAARREVRAGVGGAGQGGGEEPGDADRRTATRRPGARTPARWTSRTPSGGAPSGGRSTAEDRTILMAAYTAGRTGGSYAEGIEVMIRAALQSPHFLYRLETTAPADRERAARAAQPVRAGVAAVVPDLGVRARRRAAGRRRARRAGRQDGRRDEGARDARRSEGARGDHRLLQPVDRHQPPRHHHQEPPRSSRPTRTPCATR